MNDNDWQVLPRTSSRGRNILLCNYQIDRASAKSSKSFWPFFAISSKCCYGWLPKIAERCMSGLLNNRGKVYFRRRSLSQLWSTRTSRSRGKGIPSTFRRRSMRSSGKRRKSRKTIPAPTESTSCIPPCSFSASMSTGLRRCPIPVAAAALQGLAGGRIPKRTTGCGRAVV